MFRAMTETTRSTLSLALSIKMVLPESTSFLSLSACNCHWVACRKACPDDAYLFPQTRAHVREHEQVELHVELHGVTEQTPHLQVPCSRRKQHWRGT
jgi:hypothetical protein